MAEKIKFTIDIDDNGSAKVVDKLNDGLKDTKKAGDKAADGIEATSKAAKKGEGTFQKLGGAIKGAFAIGGVMKVLDILASLFMENQKVVDLMSQAMVVLQGVMNGVIEVLDPLFVALQKVFKDPVQSIKDFGNLIQENMMNRLNGILELIPKLGEAFSLLFEGEFTEAGKVAANAFGKVVLGVEDTVGAVQELGEKASDAFNTIAKSTKKAFDNKDFLANAEFNINKLAALYSGIVEKYDLMAEKQRQIRDDETKTISERIAANAKLAKVLNDGQAAEKLNIQKRIDILSKEQKILGYKRDRELEIIALEQEKTGVTAKYAGLRSEQLTNINSLEKEGIELKKAELTGTIEANALMAQSDADLLGETLEGFAAKKQALTDEFVARRALLDSEIAANKEGTQAYVDAVNERKLLDAQYAVDTKALVKGVQDFKTKQIQKDIDDTKKANDEKYAQEALRLTQTLTDEKELAKALEQLELDRLANQIQARKDAGQVTTDLEQALVNKKIEIAKKEFDTKKALDQAKFDSEMELMAATSGALKLFASLAGEQTAAGKVLALASTVIDTYMGATKALAAGAGTPAGYINAAAIIATGLANVRTITAVQVPNETGVSAPSMPSISGPSVGIIQGQMSQTSQLQAEMNAQMKRPTRAYVVGQNVTTQQSLDRHILENATL
jgi:hypothetical protein